MHRHLTATALVAALTLLAGCADGRPPSLAAASRSPASLQPPSFPALSPGFTVGPSHAPSPSPASTNAIAQPTPRAAPVLKAGDVARTISPNLRVRSKPGVGASSRVYRPKLPLGTRFVVIGGPVRRAGYSWYKVRPVWSAEHTWPGYGWVAAADRDGTPWIAWLRDPIPAVLASTWGTADVDGVPSPGEWESSARIDFEALMPPIDGGALVPASIFVMNDALNLYLAASLGGIPGCTYHPVFMFDNNNDGVPGELSDDWLQVHLPASAHGSVELLDAFVYPEGNVGLDTFTRSDYPPAGTIDGQAAGSHPGGTTTWVEMSHPLDGADDLHDFSLRPGDRVGLGFDAHTLGTGCGNCEPVSSCNSSTSIPTAGSVVELAIALPPR